jgi:hypothetical protein
LSVLYPIVVPCKYCGAGMLLNNFAVGDQASMTFNDCSIGPCAECRAHTFVRHATFKASEAIGGLLFSRDLSVESAHVLIRYLESVKGKDVATEEIAENLAAAIPGAKKDNLLKVLNKDYGLSVGNMLAILLALLLWYVGPRGSAASDATTKPVPALVRPTAPPEPIHPYHRAHRKLGRNELCSCESGKKAKKCHPERCE